MCWSRCPRGLSGWPSALGGAVERGGPARGPARAATGRRAVALLPQTRLDRGPRTPDEQAGGVGVSGCRGAGGTRAQERGRAPGRASRSSTPAPVRDVGRWAIDAAAVTDEAGGAPGADGADGADRPKPVRSPSEARPHVASGDIRLRGDEARWLAARPGSPVAVKAALRHVPNRAARTLLPNARILSHYVTGKFFSGRFVMLLFTILNSYSSTFKCYWARFRCCAGCAGRETR